MPPDCQSCPVRRDGLCASVADEQLSVLVDLKRPLRTVHAGAHVFFEGDENDLVYIIRRGWAVVSTLHENGRRQVLRFAMPGNLVGFAMRPDGGMPCTVEALTELTVCPMPRRTLMQLCQEMPRLALHMASQFAAETITDWQLLGGLGTCSAVERIARLFLTLCNLQRRGAAADTQDMVLPISQTLIADATGLTPVHVCRTLKEMRLDGLLTFAKGHLRVMDWARLSRLAEMDAVAAPPPAPAMGPRGCPARPGWFGAPGTALAP